MPGINPLGLLVQFSEITRYHCSLSFPISFPPAGINPSHIQQSQVSRLAVHLRLSELQCRRPYLASLFYTHSPRNIHLPHPSRILGALCLELTKSKSLARNASMTKFYRFIRFGIKSSRKKLEEETWERLFGNWAWYKRYNAVTRSLGLHFALKTLKCYCKVKQE